MSSEVSQEATPQVAQEPTVSKSELYATLATQLRSLLAGERNLIANAANFSSLVYHALPDVNWAGFYFRHGNELILGPFQGQPACVRIEVGKGVCGLSVAQLDTIIVPNVHEFPGHIACDAASNAEIVVPVFDGQHCLGVFDLDSPQPNRFDDIDRKGLESIAQAFLNSLD